MARLKAENLLDSIAYHNQVLPEGVPEDLKDTRVLWNRVEAREVRKDAQVAKEIVLALPDDAQVSLDDKVVMTKSFIEQHFVSKGLVCQIDIHAPHNTSDKNWHAHILMTTRPLMPEGNFGPKARDLDVDVRFGRVMSSDKQWGKLWSQHQNDYFAQHGMDIRVDHTGFVRDRFWAQKDLILVEGNRYTAKFVKEEEMKLVRLSERVHDRFYKNHDFYNQPYTVQPQPLPILITDQERDGFICIEPGKIDERFKGADLWIDESFVHVEKHLRDIGIGSCTILNHDQNILIGVGDRFYQAYAKTDLNINKLVFMDRLQALEDRLGLRIDDPKSTAIKTLEDNERDIRPSLDKKYGDKDLVTQILAFQERTGSMPDDLKMAVMKEKIEIAREKGSDEYSTFKSVSMTLSASNTKTVEQCIELSTHIKDQQRTL